ncbi:TPA: hypothetical protein HA278_01555 [Candidatus Woesearchaeota archaeon]|nr:hypothetical protein [Candidatus Woesearchaeota archaeon]
MKQTNEVATATKKGNLPEKKFRAGAISATVWLNQGQRPTGETVEYRTVSLERSYQKEGTWHTTSSLRINDVPKAEVVLKKAYEYIVLTEQTLFASV